MKTTRSLGCCLLVSLCTVACGGLAPPSTLGYPDAAANGGTAGGSTSSGGAAGAAATSPGAGGNGSGTGGADPSGAGGRQPCLDTSSDPNNCGRCGNKCGSVLLASGQSFPQAIAVKGGNVYWVNAGTALGQGWLMKIPVAGGVPVALASGHEFGRIAADVFNVYFTDSNAGTVMKVPGGGGTPTTIASKQVGPRAIAVDATHVYWTTYSTAGCPDDGGPCAPDGTIMKVPIGGGTPATLASGQESPGGLAVDGQNVYWTSLGIRIQDGAVMKAPLGGGATTTLASGQWGVGADIAVGAGYVYWTGNSGAADTPTVRKVPISGGPVTTVVSGSANGVQFWGDALIARATLTRQTAVCRQLATCLAAASSASRLAAMPTYIASAGPRRPRVASRRGHITRKRNALLDLRRARLPVRVECKTAAGSPAKLSQRPPCRLVELLLVFFAAHIVGHRSW